MATTAQKIGWTAKAILAGVLAAAGVVKLFTPPHELARIFAWITDVPPPLDAAAVRVVAVVELAGAVALVVPRWNAFVALLARMATRAAALALILEGAPNLAGGDPGALGASTVVAGLAVFVARGSAVPRRGRSVAAAAALLACASPACRTPEASRSAAPAGVQLAADRPERRPPTPVVDAPVRALAVDDTARVIVTPSGGGYLVLRVFPEQLPDGVVLTVLYHAGDDAEEPARRGAEAGLASAAQDLAGAFGPFADLGRIERVSVTGVFGRPGESGAIEQRCFKRDAGQWRACGVRRVAVTQVPPIEMKVVRDRDAEVRARRVAGEFISETDRADYDAAWARTSALAKATMTRTEFERCLAALRHAAAGGDPPLYLALPATGARFVPGSSMEGWFARARDDGPSVEALTLRLDDDLEWRVASFVELTPAAGSAANGVALKDPSEI